jgi:flagellar M-ring protein FliF
MEFWRKFGQQFSQMWQGLGPRRQAGLTFGFIICVGAAAAVWYWAAQTEYAVLFAGLAPEDAGAITAKLQTLGVPYRLAAGGTTVLVPADQVHQKRVEMAVDGLPAKGGKGFELFDSSPLGMTPFTQHVNYMRALQAELAKTISQIDPIMSARVHIVRPDPSPFIREQKPTTASVMLQLRPGATLNRHVAMGIVALVSRSIEGLTPEQVTLVDGNGRLLSDPSGGEGGSIATQMDYRRELESYLSTKAEEMLAQVLGTGRAIVRVTADINFQHQHEKKETYNPEGRVATSETITSSKSSGNSGGAARGPAGTASNVGKPPASAPGGSNNNQDETTKTDYLVSKVTQEYEDKLGTIERLTVAAMIDLSPPEAGKSGATPNSFTIAEAQEIIKQAVGFKTNRGDEIKVSNVKLSPPAPLAVNETEPDQLQYWLRIISIVRNGSLGLAAMVALVLGWLALRRFRPAPESGSATAPATAESAPAQQRLVSLLEQNPDAIAKVLADWLDQPDRQRKAA